MSEKEKSSIAVWSEEDGLSWKYEWRIMKEEEERLERKEISLIRARAALRRGVEIQVVHDF